MVAALLLWLFTSSGVLAEENSTPPLEIDTVSYMVDDFDQVTIADLLDQIVVGHFTEQRELELPVLGQPVWFRISLRNSHKKEKSSGHQSMAENWVLDTGSHTLEEVELYVVSGGRLLTAFSSGISQPDSHKHNTSGDVHIPFSLQRDGNTLLYLRLFSNFPTPLLYKIYSGADYAQVQQQRVEKIVSFSG